MNWIGRGVPAWILLGAQMVIAAPAVAQVGAGVLTGKVEDAATRLPAPDVVVTATSTALQGEQIAITDATGTFRIPNLPPGDYSVRFEKESFKPFSRTHVGLRADSTIRIDAQLLPESVRAEEVVVVAQAPTVDVGSTHLGTTVTADIMRRIPLTPPSAKGAGAKSFESLAMVAPGARADAFGVSISGASSPENQFLVDGLSVNNTAYGTLGAQLSSEFAQEVNVISGGYLPEYGRATGGILSVVTKSGGNEFHGGAWAEYSPGFLAESPKPVVAADNIIRTDRKLSSIWNLGFDVGGPIQKDKLWFYVGFQVARSSFTLERSLNPFLVDEVPNPDTGLPERRVRLDSNGFPQWMLMPGSEHTYYARMWGYQAFGKLTYTINPSHRLVMSFFALPTHSGGNGDFSFSADRGEPEVSNINGRYETLAAVRRADAWGGMLNLTSEFNNKRILLDTVLGWHHQGTTALPVDGSTAGQGLAGLPIMLWRRTKARSILDVGDPDVSDPSLCEAAGTAQALACPVVDYLSGGRGVLDRKNDRYQLKTVLSYFAEAAGHHVLKIGVDGELSTYDFFRAGRRVDRVADTNGTVAFIEQPNGDITMTGNGFLTGPDQSRLLDILHYKTRSVTAGGFVQDSWSVLDKVTLNLGARYDAQYLFNRSGDLALSLPNQWSPRVGVIYDPTQRGRSKVFAHYARFYELVPLDMVDILGSGQPGVRVYVDPKACDPRDPEQLTGACQDPQNRVTNPIGSNPNRSWTILAAGSTPVDAALKPQSGDEIVIGADYDLFHHGRASLHYTRRWMNNIIEDMSRDEARTYFIGNPGSGIARDFPKAERNYDAVTAQIQKVFSDHWLIDGSYTLAWLRGNYSGLFRPESGQLDPNINSDFDLISLLPNRTGPLPGDRRHQIRVFGAYELPLPNAMHATFGGSLSARSGEPTSYLGAHWRYGPGEVFVLPRGSGERLPWVFGSDLHLGYGFKVWGDKGIEFTLDVFNLFNWQAVTAREQRLTRANVLPIVNGTRADLPTPPNSQTGQPGSPGQLKTDQGEPFNVKDDYNKNFGNATAYQDPRYFKFGVRASF